MKFFLFLNWSTVALQRCVNFLLHDYVYTYIPSLIEKHTLVLRLEFFFKFIFGCVGLLCFARLSLAVVNMSYSLLRSTGFSLRWFHLFQSTGSRARTQQLWHMGLVAPRHVGSSQTRDPTCVPCIGRQILNHCNTNEL